MALLSKLKYVFQLEENMSHAVGQNSPTPWGKENSQTLKGNNFNFWLAHEKEQFYKVWRCHVINNTRTSYRYIALWNCVLEFNCVQPKLSRISLEGLEYEALGII